MVGPERFRPLPKAELHVHLDGSLRPATLVALSDSAGLALPTRDPVRLARHMAAAARDLEDYLSRFALTVAVLQTPEALERVAYEMVEDAAADGIRYLEVRYCPALSLGRGLTLDDVVAAERRGLVAGERAFGVRTAIINCTLRHFTPEQSLEIAEASVRQTAQGVAGFDLAGGEASFPAAPHREAFAVARRGGLRLTVHAGEAAGPPSLREAIFDCQADRIGHGTRLCEDPELMAVVRDRGIPIEINLTSNVQTGVVPRPAAHPVRSYLDAGLRVTLCTDNWLMSGVTLSGEYAVAATALELSSAQLRQLILEGFRAGFLPPPERERLIAEVTPALGALA
jgi:adenosine deaminase